jgi:sn-glycerol 3-phosphate transport system substrate-binding protein
VIRVGRRGALAGAAGLALAGGAGCASRADSPEAALWYAYGGKNREVLLELVARFHATHPQHRVVPTYQGDYFELLAKLRTAMHAGVVPSVTHVVGEVIPYLDQAEVLAPLEPLGLDDRDVIDALAQRGTFQGGGDRPLVGLPFNRSTPIAYFNGQILEELGLAPPRTWEDLRAFARAASRGKDAERRFGFGCPVDWWFWVALVAQAGGSVIEAGGEVTLGGEAGVRSLAMWQDMVNEGVMRPPPGRDYNAWQVVNADFLSGRVAMIWTSTAFLRYLEQNAKFPVIAAPLPGDVRRGVPTGGTFFVVPRRAPERQLPAASAFLRFMMEPAQANHFATKTGYIPVSRTGVAELEASGVLAKQPNDRVALDQLEHAFSWPWSPRLFRIQRDVVQPRLEGAVLARRPAAEALAEAREAAKLED